MNDIWLPVHKPPFSRHYEVSRDGRVRRVPSLHPSGRHIRGGELRKVLVRGYHLVLIQCEGQKWMVRVHHLVAYAFHGYPPEPPSLLGIHVNHKNGKKLDNHAENLEWISAKANEEHAKLNGLKARGERQHLAVLDETRVRLARQLYSAGTPISVIAVGIGCSHGAASSVIHGRTWRHVT